MTHSKEKYTLNLLVAAGCPNGLTLRHRNGILPLEQNGKYSLSAHFLASSVMRWKAGCSKEGDRLGVGLRV